MMLRWDRVLQGSLPTRAEGPGLAPHCCGEPAKGHWGFPPVGWAMPKVLGTLQPTFFPGHGFLVPGRCCWPPACPRDSASHQPRPNNSHKSGGCLPACLLLGTEQPLGGARAVPRASRLLLGEP